MEKDQHIDAQQSHDEQECKQTVMDTQSFEEALRDCQTERAQLQERYVRALADLENFKRRVQQERIHWSHSAQTQLLLPLLAVVDNFDRALKAHEVRGHDPAFDAWFEGFETIAKELHKFLERFEVRPVENETVFDPELHEAVNQVESSEHESGQIVQVYEQGYRFGKTLLRPSKVSVAK